MCGIFGYSDFGEEKGQKEVAETLIRGLERMEYRGYDSAGLCIVGENTEVVYEKVTGRVANLYERARKATERDAHGMLLGIAHTRWATHGKSTETNAHPVRSDLSQQFFVVHNGIINNFQDLKAMLVEKGCEFETQTDTEVAAKLALHFYEEDKKRSFVEIVRMVMDACEGEFAFIFISKHFPGKMVVSKIGAPIIIGVGAGKGGAGKDGLGAKRSSFVISSDITAIVEHTKDVVYLEDSDVVEVSDGGLDFHSAHGGPRDIIRVETSLDEVVKGNFDHFMLKEIYEQQESILNTMRNRIDFSQKRVTLDTLESHRDKLIGANRYIFIACGTSYNSSLAVKKVFEELTDRPVSVEIASNFMDFSPHIYKDDVVFLVSQSGETADTLMVLNYCRDAGATTVGITNTPSSAIARETSCKLDLHAGVEKGVASTKAYTSQFVSIILIALYISQEKSIHRETREEIVAAMEELPEKIKKTIDVSVDSFVERLNKRDSLIVIGRGYQAATCMEGSLKIKELSYIHAEGIMAGELKHGPLALVHKDQSIMLVICSDQFYPKSHSSLEQIQARGGEPLVVCTEDVQDKYAMSVAVPKTIDCLQGILTIIPFQKISYQLAVKRGFNPDFPRNLAKSVTVE